MNPTEEKELQKEVDNFFKERRNDDPLDRRQKKNLLKWLAIIMSAAAIEYLIHLI